MQELTAVLQQRGNSACAEAAIAAAAAAEAAVAAGANSSISANSQCGLQQEGVGQLLPPATVAKQAEVQTSPRTAAAPAAAQAPEVNGIMQPGSSNANVRDLGSSSSSSTGVALQPPRSHWDVVMDELETALANKAAAAAAAAAAHAAAASRSSIAISAVLLQQQQQEQKVHLQGQQQQQIADGGICRATTSSAEVPVICSGSGPAAAPEAGQPVEFGLPPCITTVEEAHDAPLGAGEMRVGWLCVQSDGLRGC
jgi:hypothetical protein